MDFYLSDSLKNLASFNGVSEDNLKLSLECIRQLSQCETYCLSLEVFLSSDRLFSQPRDFTVSVDVAFDYVPCEDSPVMYFLKNLRDLFVEDLLREYPDYSFVSDFKVLSCWSCFHYPFGIQSFRHNSVEVKKDVEVIKDVE